MGSAILPLLFILTTALSPNAGRVKEAALDQEFEIKVGEQVLIEGERLLVSFSHVAEDSRCPEGVQCVWQGNGRVVLRLSKARRRPTTMNLNTTLDPKHSAYRGYDVKLVKLEPYPKERRPIRKRAYVATLVVSRN